MLQVGHCKPSILPAEAMACERPCSQRTGVVGKQGGTSKREYPQDACVGS